MSNDRGQISLFGEIENQPGAEQWVQQRAGKEKLNENASSIAEYDGDVFLPTGIFSYQSASCFICKACI